MVLVDGTHGRGVEYRIDGGGHALTEFLESDPQRCDPQRSEKAEGGKWDFDLDEVLFHEGLPNIGPTETQSNKLSGL